MGVGGWVWVGVGGCGGLGGCRVWGMWYVWCVGVWLKILEMILT